MLRVGSLFSGIGGYEKALEKMRINYDLKFYCETNKIKSKAYSLLHNVSEDKNLEDVTKVEVEKLEDIDILFFSPPCSSFSVAGNRKGLDDIRGTLFWDSMKVLERTKPKYCLMENVDNLPIKFKEDFNKMIKSLEEVGYNAYWKIINAKDFIPQNRSRVYIVGIRKDIDDNSDYNFKFPIGNNNEKWYEFINPYDTRPLTNRQQRMIDYAKGINKEDKIKIEGKIDFNESIITLRQSGLRFQQNREYQTIVARYGTGGGNFSIIAYKGHLGGITPRSCFKLMGFDCEDSDLLTENKFSVNNQYIMAGDSVCVPVIEGIIENILKYENKNN